METDLTKAGPFAKLSRMIKGTNWVPNTTRGTNNYSHFSHAIYVYEQNANPVLLQWLTLTQSLSGMPMPLQGWSSGFGVLGHGGARLLMSTCRQRK